MAKVMQHIGTMPRTLTNEDVEAIALRLFQNICSHFMTEVKPKEVQPPPPQPPPSEIQQADIAKLTCTVGELSAELRISKPTIYRLVRRGLLRPLPYFRHKVFLRAEVERFLADAADASNDSRHNQ